MLLSSRNSAFNFSFPRNFLGENCFLIDRIANFKTNVSPTEPFAEEVVTYTQGFNLSLSEDLRGRYNFDFKNFFFYTSFARYPTHAIRLEVDCFDWHAARQSANKNNTLPKMAFRFLEFHLNRFKTFRI